MAESKVIDNKYIKVNGWMVSKLKLKGLQILVYAIIYYFNQKDNGKFTGGLQYLADWTNSTPNGCLKCLKTLVKQGLIIKEPRQAYNKAYYYINWNTLKNIAEKNDFDYSPSATDEQIRAIIYYFNEKTGQHISLDSKEIADLINNWFRKGFEIRHFGLVIDKMVYEWEDSEEMKGNIRPSVLFGKRFEEYLNLEVSCYISPEEKEAFEDEYKYMQYIYSDKE